MASVFVIFTLYTLFYRMSEMF